MNRWLPHPLLTPALALVWLLLNNSFAPGQILLVLYDIVVANLRVAWLVLAGPRQLRPLFVEVPLRLTNDLAISLLANTICLTPGTVSARLSADRATLLVHALDAADAAAVVADIKARYEAPLAEIFEC